MFAAATFSDKLKAASALAACGLLAWARFSGWDLASASDFVAEGAFWFMAAAVLFLAFSLLHLFWPHRTALRLQPHLPGLAIALASALFIVLTQPWFPKVEFDESSHLLGTLGLTQGTALLPVSAHRLAEGALHYEGFTIAHRLPLLSWLVSLPVSAGAPPLQAAFGVNLCLGFTGVFLAWLAGRQLAGTRGGLLASCALGFHPLWAENVSCAGYDILNACLLLGFFLAALGWWRERSGPRLNVLAALAALLALARYESILHTVTAAALALAGWWGARKIVLTWPAALSPLLVAPALALNLASMRAFEGGVASGQRPFGPEHWPGNAAGLLRHLFGGAADSSPLLVALALAALFLLWRKTVPRGSVSPVLPVFVGFTAAIYGLVVMSMHWSAADDPLAARFTLPLWISVALLAALLGHLAASRWLTPALCLAGAATSLVNASRAPERFPIGQAWRDCDTWKLPPDVLILAESNNRLILRSQPSVMLSRLQRPDALLDLLDASVYREIWILRLTKSKPLPPGYQLAELNPRDHGLPANGFTLHRIEGFTPENGPPRLPQPGRLQRPLNDPPNAWALGWVMRLHR